MHLVGGGALFEKLGDSSEDHHTTPAMALNDLTAEGDISKEQLPLADIEEFIEDPRITGETQRSVLKHMRMLVSQFRLLACFFHRSAAASVMLTEIQVDQFNVPKEKALRTRKDCCTRFNSCYEMLV